MVLVPVVTNPPPFKNLKTKKCDSPLLIKLRNQHVIVLQVRYVQSDQEETEQGSS